MTTPCGCVAREVANLPKLCMSFAYSVKHCTGHRTLQQRLAAKELPFYVLISVVPLTSPIRFG